VNTRFPNQTRTAGQELRPTWPCRRYLSNSKEDAPCTHFIWIWNHQMAAIIFEKVKRV